MATISGGTNGPCRLCLANRELQFSHVFPRFAVKYLKESSASGFLKNLASAKRSQEARRVYLLCESCEQLLSRDEKSVCEQLFVPLHKENKNSFDYDTWLIRFLVGLHWKVLVTRDDKYPSPAEEIYAKAESDWREFLLGQRASHGSSEFHLFFTDVIVNSSAPVSQKLNWYMARSIDAAPTFTDSGHAGSYAKLVRVLSYAFITARPEEEKWIGTQVYERGTIAGPQKIETYNFGPFIDSRVRAVEAAPATMTPRQIEKFKQTAVRDPERFLNSESTRVFLANRELERQIAAREAVGRSGRKSEKCCGRRGSRQ